MIRTLIALTVVFFAAFSFAQETKKPAHNYQCIADALQAYNSSIYYDLSAEDIDNILNDQGHAFYSKVSRVAYCCDQKNNAQCED